jgi:hypothetical protein
MRARQQRGRTAHRAQGTAHLAALYRVPLALAVLLCQRRLCRRGPEEAGAERRADASEHCRRRGGGGPRCHYCRRGAPHCCNVNPPSQPPLPPSHRPSHGHDGHERICSRSRTNLSRRSESQRSGEQQHPVSVDAAERVIACVRCACWLCPRCRALCPSALRSLAQAGRTVCNG